jgi:hypothetical protein
VAPRSLQLPQSHETPATQVCRDRLSYWYAFERAPDAQAAGESSQDYVELIEDEQRLVFVLCDGVSQSFFGDVAAELLGKAVACWLWNEREAVESPAWLEQRLSKLCASASERVAQIELPVDLSPLVASVLERKRAGGSESMFVAAALDWRRGTFALACLGDSRLRVWDRAAERTRALGIEPQCAGRWSTRRGPIGQVRVAAGALGDLTRIVAYSDGLACLDTSECRFDTPQRLDEEVRKGALLSGDDASYFAVDLR